MTKEEMKKLVVGDILVEVSTTRSKLFGAVTETVNFEGDPIFDDYGILVRWIDEKEDEYLDFEETAGPWMFGDEIRLANEEEKKEYKEKLKNE